VVREGGNETDLAVVAGDLEFKVLEDAVDVVE